MRLFATLIAAATAVAGVQTMGATAAAAKSCKQGYNRWGECLSLSYRPSRPAVAPRRQAVPPALRARTGVPRFVHMEQDLNR